jgi:hypothetical protein
MIGGIPMKVAIRKLNIAPNDGIVEGPVIRLMELELAIFPTDWRRRGGGRFTAGDENKNEAEGDLKGGFHIIHFGDRLSAG